jgi:hypothetical protein
MAPRWRAALLDSLRRVFFIDSKRPESTPPRLAGHYGTQKEGKT